MRFTWNQGNGSFGQMGPRVPRPVNTYQGSPMGGMPNPNPMAGGGYPYGMSPGGMPPGGMSQRVMPQGGMPYGGMSAGRPPGMPGGIPQMGMPSQGGSIRNNLGSELKKRGFFQKDGQINNLRGGFFGAKPHKPVAQAQGGESMAGPFSFLGNGGGAGTGMQPRQLVLEATQAGINANGIASISPDNVFSCIANLPSPNTLTGSPGTYAAYLVDSKGQSGFLAGVLRPVGNGVYQAQFRSQVPLNHYGRVIITVENPQQLGNVPQGPIVLQVKQAPGPIRFLTPIKKAGGSVWSKVTGLIQRRMATPDIVEGVVSGGEALASGTEITTGVEEAVVEGTAIGSSTIEPIK